MSKKDLALKLAVDQITSSFGNGSIMWLGRDVSHKHPPVISTGSFALDVALGIGGLPKVFYGHITLGLYHMLTSMSNQVNHYLVFSFIYVLLSIFDYRLLYEKCAAFFQLYTSLS